MAGFFENTEGVEQTSLFIVFWINCEKSLNLQKIILIMATPNKFNFKKVTKLVRFDWFMKNMLRDKGNFEILEGFLSELLHETVTIIEIIESESNKSDKKNKFNRVDILVKTDKDERVIIEIQNNTEYDYLLRILFGACKTIVENMVEGEHYSTIKRIISVSIVYFPIAQGADYIYHGQTQFRGVHLNDALVLSQDEQAELKAMTPEDVYPHFYIIKADTFGTENIKDTLDEWVYFFSTGKVVDGFSAQGLAKAKHKLDVAKMNKKQRREYDFYLEELRDEASWNSTVRIDMEKAEREAEAKGRALGEALGEAKGKALGEAKKEAETVIRLFLKGKTAEEIADLLDLPIEKVQKIMSDYQANQE
jgi:predicted transposase/invertase (TIGR01784 family)